MSKLIISSSYLSIIIRVTLVIIVLQFAHFSYSQTNWETVGKIYEGNGVTVELSYKLRPDSCEPNSFKKSKFQYTIDGTFSGRDLYLNWKMDYLHCNGMMLTQTNWLNIGKNDIGTIISDEYTFDGYKITELSVNWFTTSISVLLFLNLQ